MTIALLLIFAGTVAGQLVDEVSSASVSCARRFGFVTAAVYTGVSIRLRRCGSA